MNKVTEIFLASDLQSEKLTDIKRCMCDRVTVRNANRQEGNARLLARLLKGGISPEYGYCNVHVYNLVDNTIDRYGDCTFQNGHMYSLYASMQQTHDYHWTYQL